MINWVMLQAHVISSWIVIFY